MFSKSAAAFYFHALGVHGLDTADSVGFVKLAKIVGFSRVIILRKIYRKMPANDSILVLLYQCEAGNSRVFI